MSRRGIHPLLMGLDRPARDKDNNQKPELSGNESAQRKRFLRAESEGLDTNGLSPSSCSKSAFRRTNTQINMHALNRTD